MDKEAIGELIDTIAQGSAIDAEAQFNSIMAAKVAERLDSFRQDVASTLFTSPAAEQE